MAEVRIIDQLGVWLEELARKWDRHVSGDPQVPVPPERERAALERRLKELSRTEQHTAADRFRLEQLLHRFSTYNALWQRQLRGRETADVHGGRARANVAPATPVPPSDDEYRRLHARYVELLRAAGRASAVTPERFRETLEAERKRLVGQGGEVEGFEVVENGGSVRVRARLRRRRQE